MQSPLLRNLPHSARAGAPGRNVLRNHATADRRRDPLSTADAFLAVARSAHSNDPPGTWTGKIADGRTIHVCRKPTPDGGWIAIHEDISELKAARAAADERLSLQALIDLLPDNLWVKDAKSRFVISNKVTAFRMGLAGPADLIGKTDLELLSPDIANKFFADEQAIVRSGRPMIDMEECIFGAAGEKTWILTTKVPSLNDRNEIVGVVGI